MSTSQAENTIAERGSAMIISVLVTAIMSLLGISYLLMADTENRIAENEKLAGQSLYFGEGTVREVKRWFDRPPYSLSGSGGKNLVKPLTGVIDRTQRWLDLDGDPTTLPTAADGTLALPYYKVGIDRDADGNDDIFDKPYRSGLGDMLVGTEDHPDIRIDRSVTAQATFLDGLADKIAPNFPAASAGIRARIKTIDIYEPPYLEISGVWTRFGMATVKATVQIIRTRGSTTAVIAERVVKAVLNETPFPGPFGPLHSCDEMKFTGDFLPHWGTSTAIGDLTLTNGANNKIPMSLPRDIPPSAKVDRLHGWNDAAMWAGMYKTAAGTMVGQSIEDPWYRFMLDGHASQWPAIVQQPYPPPVALNSQDESNKIQFFGGVGCPSFDYDTWRQIAKSGTSDVHYYAWDNGTDFRENGVGGATDFIDLTDNRQGLFFFDTKDGIAPHDPDAFGVAVNLTPEMQVSANYGVRGFLYTNTAQWTSQGTVGRPVTMHWPAEPFRDANENGRYDPGEDFVNLNYSTISTTDPSVAPVVKRADAGAGTDLYGSTDGINPVWNARGPDITGKDAVVWGVLYVAGTFDSQGTPLYYGSVVTKAGMNNAMAGTPDLYWDTDLKDNWPPPGWDLPRVIITKWETDL